MVADDADRTPRGDSDDKLRGDREYEQMLAEIRNYADKYRQEFGSSSF